MANSNRTQPQPNETADSERVRGSNDRDQAAEREGIETDHNRGYDEATRARESSDEEFEDIDPDSAESDVDRDDSVDEI